MDYKTKLTPLCPVAIRIDQPEPEVHAPDHSDWGEVQCSGCKAKFVIGPHRIYGSRMTEAECRKTFEAMLADDHVHNREHQNGYKIPDY